MINLDAVISMIRFIFFSFGLFCSYHMLDAMLGFIMVFGVFRLTYFLLAGGEFNRD